MSKKRDPNALQDEARNLPKHSASKSRLLPHLATIRILREKRYTWRAIAKWLSERGCRINASALHEFVARIDKSAAPTETSPPAISSPKSPKKARGQLAV